MTRVSTDAYAPVSGGPAGAISGKLAILVGGNKTAFGRCKPVLDGMADQACYIGPIGAGSIAKLTHNLASATLAAMLAEVDLPRATVCSAPKIGIGGHLATSPLPHHLAYGSRTTAVRPD
jgi:hypothetical protein